VQHVFASVAARQIGVFSLRIAHIVHSLFNSKKGIFILMVPKDLNAFLTFVHAAKTAVKFFDLILGHKKCRQTKYRQIL